MKGKHYKWTDLIKSCLDHNNCCVDGKHIIVIDLHTWTRMQVEWMDKQLSMGKDPREDDGCIFRKKTLVHIVECMSQGKTFTVGKYPERAYSIFVKNRA